MSTNTTTHAQSRENAPQPAPTPAISKRRKHREAARQIRPISPAPGAGETPIGGFEVPIAETGQMFHSVWRFGE